MVALLDGEDPALVLIDIVERSSDNDMRVAALEGLGYLGNSLAQAFLQDIALKRLDEFSPELVRVALVAFGRAHRAS